RQPKTTLKDTCRWENWKIEGNSCCRPRNQELEDKYYKSLPFTAFPLPCFELPPRRMFLSISGYKETPQPARLRFYSLAGTFVSSSDRRLPSTTTIW
ncbi:hypothetical protein HPP92_021675, partial [Vanilla planifolia]